MLVLPRRVEHAFDVTIPCPHDTDARSHGHVSTAEQVGVRRETLRRYKAGTVLAPFETLVKIMAAVGAKLVVVRR